MNFRIHVTLAVPLIFFLVATSFGAPKNVTGETRPPETPPIIRWDMPVEHQGFIPYKQIVTVPAIYNLEPRKLENGHYLLKASEQRSYMNPEFKKEYDRRGRFFLYPLMQGDSPEVTFFSKQLPTSVPDFNHIVVDDHFVWIPGGREGSIRIPEMSTSGHRTMDFPIGTMFVHRLMLNNQERTPLEFRFTKLGSNNKWYYGVYDVAPGSEGRAHNETTMVFRLKRSWWREVPPFDNLIYGRMSFKYQTVQSVPFTRETVVDGKSVRTKSEDDCTKCHAVPGLREKPEARLLLLQNMQSHMDHRNIPQSIQEFDKLATAQESWRNETNNKKRAALKRATVNGQNQSPVNRKNVRPDPDDAQEGDRLYAAKMTGYEFHELKTKFGTPEFKPCGFFVPHEDDMSFFSDLEKYTSDYKKIFGQSPFQSAESSQCTLPEVKIGQIVTIRNSRFNDRDNSQLIRFKIVERRDDRSWLAHTVDREFIISKPGENFNGLQLRLKSLANGHTEFEMIYPVAEINAFAQTVRWESEFPFHAPKGEVKYLACEKYYTDGAPKPHDPSSMDPSLKKQFERSSFYWNMNWIQNLMATRVLGGMSDREVTSPSHGMGHIGYNFHNNTAVQLNLRLTADQIFSRFGYLNPAAAGEYDRHGNFIKNRTHEHSTVGGLEIMYGGRWGRGHRNSIFGVLAPVGQAPVGAQVEYMRPSAEFQRPGQTHHSISQWHQADSVSRVDVTLGDPMRESSWFISAGAYKEAFPIPSQHRLSLERPDSWAAKITRTFNRTYGNYTFGASAAWQTGRHGVMGHSVEPNNHSLPAANENPHSESHGAEGMTTTKEEKERERYQVISFEMQSALSRSLQFAVGAFYGRKQKGEGVNFNTFMNEFVMKLGKDQNYGLFGGIQIQEVSPEVFEIRTFNPETRIELLKTIHLGVYRTLKRTPKWDLTATAEYSPNFLPEKFLPGGSVTSSQIKKVHQVSFNLWWRWGRRNHSRH